ncbi:hypothetical protein KIH39_00120 [Telmatocola sphagniphila]|uniref:Uncharacterized protein n=1 Tax=Telmatocola sphagniphila TaxID=1123043 RepID=A0A8E6B8I2_9BACT|nr:hypothetical protein [Telmatocola sphagniphila]QVL32360.1 hypothetical protein KIH39_00120 [Telmatocola sphagniphila]
MTFSLKTFLKLFQASQDPRIMALVDEVEAAYSGGLANLTLKQVRALIRDFHDVLQVASKAFPDSTLLKTLQEQINDLFEFAPKMGSIVDIGVAKLKGTLSSDATLEEATQAATKWVTEFTGKPVNAFGPFLLFAVKLIARILLGLL